MDTKYLYEAFEDFKLKACDNPGMKIGDLTINQLSEILHRAQEFKLRDATERLALQLERL